MKISLYPTPIVALATFSGFWGSKKLGRHATDHQDGQSIMFVLSFTRGLYVSFYFDNEIAFLA